MPILEQNRADGLRLNEFFSHLHDSLGESAELMWRQAGQTCRNPVADQPCRAYHRVWQTLRLLGFNTSLESDSEFLLGTLRDLFHNGEGNNILICGTADYGMLAHLDWASRLAGCRPAITVLDRCATPLVVNRWYAQRNDLAIQTVQRDILSDEHAGLTGFDLICTHNLLGFYPALRRGEILDRWHEMLADAGELLTVVRLRPGVPAQAAPIRATPEQARDLAEQATQSFTQSALRVNISTAELQQQVYDFVSESRSYGIDSEESMILELARHGFVPRIADQHSAPNPARNYGPARAGVLSADRILLRILANKVNR